MLCVIVNPPWPRIIRVLIPDFDDQPLPISQQPESD